MKKIGNATTMWTFEWRALIKVVFKDYMIYRYTPLSLSFNLHMCWVVDAQTLLTTGGKEGGLKSINVFFFLNPEPILSFTQALSVTPHLALDTELTASQSSWALTSSEVLKLLNCYIWPYLYNFKKIRSRNFSICVNSKTSTRYKNTQNDGQLGSDINTVPLLQADQECSFLSGEGW